MPRESEGKTISFDRYLSVNGSATLYQLELRLVPDSIGFKTVVESLRDGRGISALIRGKYEGIVVKINSVLESEKCLCGAQKAPRRSFCIHCFHWIPPLIKRGLTHNIGVDYEAAYAQACEFLEQRRKFRKVRL